MRILLQQQADEAGRAQRTAMSSRQAAATVRGWHPLQRLARGHSRPAARRTMSVRQPCIAETPYLKASFSPSPDSCR